MQRSSSPDSLFKDDQDDEHTLHPPVAKRTCPPIPGLYVFPGLLPEDIASKTLRDIGEADIFAGGTRDQVMLFEASKQTDRDASSSLPDYIRHLLSTLSSLLAEPAALPPHLHRLLFSQPLARQAIINLYPGGTGITPHVDLVGRYADGVVGCSVVGGCVMTFAPTTTSKGQDRHDVYLPPRTIYVLSGPARWDWTHGIEPRVEDVVEREDRHLEPETILRDLRLSVTFRWLKPGADVLS